MNMTRDASTLLKRGNNHRERWGFNNSIFFLALGKELTLRCHQDLQIH